MSKMFCVDCGVNTTPSKPRNKPHLPWEYYMVHKSLWAEAGMEPDGMKPVSRNQFLCIGCLEVRLGRELTPQDFTDAPVNKACILDSPRLLQRKGVSGPVNSVGGWA